MVWRWMKELTRDHKLDQEYYEGLREFGIDARLPERSQEPGEIEIQGSPIGWCKIDRKASGEFDYFAATFGVPDHRLSHFRFNREVSVRAKLIRRFNVLGVGRVMDMSWAGFDYGMGIIERLNMDHSLKMPLTKALLTVGDVEVSNNSYRCCWVIVQSREGKTSRYQWEIYEKVAQHLLEAPIPNPTFE